MPLLSQRKTEHDGILGLWHITEDEFFFLDAMELSREERLFISKIKGRGRRIEWLATRYLVHVLSGRTTRLELLKDGYGKPFFRDSEYFVSISHSHDMAAVIAAPVACGIDIQFPVDKIRRLIPRFCSKEEIGGIPHKNELRIMHVLWGAKECIFKAYGRKQVDYREHIRINNPAGLIDAPEVGTLAKESESFEYEIHAEIVSDYILTYCFQKD